MPKQIDYLLDNGEIIQCVTFTKEEISNLRDSIKKSQQKETFKYKFTNFIKRLLKFKK